MERICKMCGKLLEDDDLEFAAPITYEYGYGSYYDGAKLELTLCCDCLDRLTDYIVSRCKIDPIMD